MFYGLITVAAGVVCMFQNFEAVEVGTGYPVARHHRCEDWGNIYF
jgi:hypothetical protein